jgi:hypothetical protein
MDIRWPPNTLNFLSEGLMMCKRPPVSTRCLLLLLACDLHMFRLIIKFTSCFIMSKVHKRGHTHNVRPNFTIALS